jgi:hypothetical protein
VIAGRQSSQMVESSDTSKMLLFLLIEERYQLLAILWLFQEMSTLATERVVRSVAPPILKVHSMVRVSMSTVQAFAIAFVLVESI